MNGIVLELLSNWMITLQKQHSTTGNKPKVAIQLYGHLRTYLRCAEYLQRNILSQYECDVFMHTWDKLEHTSKSWYDDKVKSDPLAVTDEIIASLHKLYAPKGLKIETQDSIKELEEKGHFGTHPTIQISLKGFKSMLYSQHQANNLRLQHEKENSIRYDYVVVLRPDILPLVPLDIHIFDKDFSFYPKTSVHLLHNSLIKLKSNRYFNYPLLFDCFFLGLPDTITTITNCYKHFDRFFKEFPKTFPPEVENPESAIMEYMLENAVVPRQYRFYYAIKRKNDGDDIVLPPPETRQRDLPQTYRLSPKQKAKNAVKLAVRFLIKYTPQAIQNPPKKGLHKLQRLYEFWDNAERELRG